MIRSGYLPTTGSLYRLREHEYTIPKSTTKRLGGGVLRAINDSARIWIGADNGQWFDVSKTFSNIQLTMKEEKSMSKFNVGDKARVRNGQEKVSDFVAHENKLFPGEYTILRVLGDFVSIDFNKPDFFQSRFELATPSLDGIGEGDVVKVATNNGLSGTFTVSTVGDSFVTSTEWEADILLDNIVSIEVVTKAKPPLPDEPGVHAIVMGGVYRPFVRHYDGWKLTGNSRGRWWMWDEILNEFRFEKSFTLLYDGYSNKAAPKVVTW